MRKSRANNGYIGKIKSDTRYDGTVPISKIYEKYKNQVDDRYDRESYIRPSNGNGNGATSEFHRG